MQIGVVMVTYNRLEKLKIALEKFEQQTNPPKFLVVVDNASTDDTPAFLNEWELGSGKFERQVVSSPINSGGSGGFHMGLEKAIDMDAEWLWVSDDDAFPEPDALQKVCEYLAGIENPVKSISAVCGTVINRGKIDLWHRRNIIQKGIRIREEIIPEEAYNQKFFRINACSYVGSVINKQKLREVGLTRKDYFIWFDDTEHSLRLSKVGEIHCVPAVCIRHDDNNAAGAELTWKNYYGIRNQIDMYRQHFPRYCYLFYCACQLLKAFLRDILGKDKERNRMIRCALRNVHLNRFGVHELYRPGWKSSNR